MTVESIAMRARTSGRRGETRAGRAGAARQPVSSGRRPALATQGYTGSFPAGADDVLPLLLALAETQYAGSPACAACHPAIYASYVRTAMGRSLRSEERRVGKEYRWRAIAPTCSADRKRVVQGELSA